MRVSLHCTCFYSCWGFHSGNRVYRLCIFTLMGYDIQADMMDLNIVEFDGILGMDWLSPYHVILNYHAKTITLAMSGIPIVERRSSLSQGK